MPARSLRSANLKLLFLLICSLFLFACTNRELPQVLTLKSQVFKADIQGPFPESGGSTTSFSWHINYPPNFRVDLSYDHVQILGSSIEGCQIEDISGDLQRRVVSIRGCEAKNASVSIQIASGSATQGGDFAPVIKGFREAKLKGDLKVDFSSSAPALNNLSTIPLRLITSNPLLQLDPNHFVLKNTSLKKLEKVSDFEWTLEIEPISDGEMKVSLPAQTLLDIFGSSNDLAEIEFKSDRTSPIIMISRKTPYDVITLGQKVSWKLEVSDSSDAHFDLTNASISLKGDPDSCQYHWKVVGAYTEVTIEDCKSYGEVWFEIGAGSAVDNAGNSSVLTTSEKIKVLEPENPFFANQLFITKWDTSLESNAEPSNQITIPLDLSKSYNFRIDWGDGTHENITNTAQNPLGRSLSHIYPTSGIYTVKMIGQIPRLSFKENSKSQNKLLRVEQWGSNEWESMAHMFFYARNFELSANDQPNLSQVTDMSSMFEGAIKFNSFIGLWDTSNINNMNSMFKYAQEFNEYIGDWNTSNVTDMASMFESARKFDQVITHWNTKNVITMNSMFLNATAFNQDIGLWDTSSVRDMSSMFEAASMFNSDIGDWDTSQVKSFSGMFSYASKFNQYIGDWNTQNSQDMSAMFSAALAFNTYIGKWKTENVRNMSSMFRDATSFNDEFIGNWDVSKVEDMSHMFEGATLFNQNLNNWNVGTVKNMNSMFARTANFNQYIGAWDVSQVLSMDSMFQNSKKFNQNLSGWRVNLNVTSVNFASGATSWTAPKPAFP